MKKKILILALGAVLPAFVATSDVHGQDMVGIEWSGDVYTVDSQNGAAQHIGSWGLAQGANAMAVAPSGQFYVARRDPANFKQSFLSRLDLTTFQGTDVGSVIPLDLRGLAFSRGGTLYAIADHNGTKSGEDELVTIDADTGAVQRIGATGFKTIQALTVRPDGSLYAWDTVFGLLAIDKGTGVAADVDGATVGNQGIQFLSGAKNGKLVGGADVLYEIDPTTGAFQPIGDGAFADLRGCDFIGPPCVESLGVGCDGSGGVVPDVSLTACVHPNGQGIVTINGGLGGSVALLVVGRDTDSTPVWGGCILYVGSVTGIFALPLAGTGPGTGTASMKAVAPPDAAGSVFVLQAFITDTGVPRGFSSTASQIIRVQ